MLLAPRSRIADEYRRVDGGGAVTDLATYAGMLLTAMIAATVVPAQSEAVLAGLLVAGQQPPWALILIASIGNTAGSCLNWLLGVNIERLRTRRWFPIHGASFDRAQRWYHKYGKWSLLLSWVPLIGDPLTLAAGVMRERFLVFLIIVGAAKTMRYVVIAALTLGAL